MSALPPPGPWALGPDAQAAAEALVQSAQRAGLRTGWLAPEACFLSNLNIEENLRLLHDWGLGDGAGFDAALARAAAVLAIDPGEWLAERPAHLRASVLLRARLLRLLLLRPDLVVLHPAQLTQAGPLAAPFIAGLAGARLLLLADASPEWPAWPPASTTTTAAATAAAGGAASPAGIARVAVPTTAPGAAVAVPVAAAIRSAGVPVAQDDAARRATAAATDSDAAAEDSAP